MSDIENELRRLGDNLRSGSRGSETLSGRQRRRIKLRRGLFAAGGAMTLIVLVATASYAFGFVQDRRDVAPAEEASSTLIRFDRSGGFTGDQHVLTIERDGSALLESSGPRGVINSVEFELEPDAITSLQDSVDDVDWPRVEGHQTGDIRIGVADGYRFEISHDGYRVVMEPGVDTGSLRPLIDLLNSIIDERLNGSVAGEPTLSLSDQTVRSGDVVGFAIQAPTRYVWGVLTTLERDRGGGWIRAGYWRTWPGKGPRILEAIATQRGAIEDIGFSGNADFRLKIPQLEPGSYRIVKEFVTPSKPGQSLEDRRAVAEVRFEVVADEASSPQQDFAAIWPEDTYENAKRSCAMDSGNSRAEPENVVVAFSSGVLGWDDMRMTPRINPPGGDRDITELRRGGPRGASPREPAVIVEAVEVMKDCWSIASVSRLPDRKPTGVGISVRGRDVELGFDTLEATEGVVEVGYGDEVKRKVWVEAEATEAPVYFRFDSRPATAGHFLILFKDAEGKVFSAAGGPLPEGDFAAG